MDDSGTVSPKPRNSAVSRQWGWLRGYNGGVFSEDLIAAIIVTILLVPQSLAYALLAGLPPQVGIYVSIFPLLAYAAFGSSRYLNVGPTAVISLMTAACRDNLIDCRNFESGLRHEFRVSPCCLRLYNRGSIAHYCQPDQTYLWHYGEREYRFCFAR